MTDLNSYGVRAESTRKFQAPIERSTPLRVIERGALLGRTRKEAQAAAGRQQAIARAAQRVLAVKTSADGKSDHRRIYAAWRARLITDRQAYVLGVPMSAISAAAGKRRRASDRKRAS